MAVGRTVSPPVDFGRSVAELVVGWTSSRPDVNRSWRRRHFVTTADAYALESHAGKTAERSAGSTEGQPSICRGDGERVVTTVHADALVSRARGRQRNSRLNAL